MAAYAQYPLGEEPTEPDLQAVGQVGRQPIFPAQGLSAGGCLGRALVVLSVLGLVAIFACGAIWGVVLRPVLHNSVDSQLRQQLSNTVDAVNSQMPELVKQLSSLDNKTGQVSVQASAVNQALAANLPQQAGISNVHAGFNAGQVIVSFRTYGLDGSVATHIVVDNGKPVVRGTTVKGLLALIESGDDVESDINDAFAQLQSGISFTKIDIANDVMYVTVQAK